MPSNQQILEKAIQKAIDGGWQSIIGREFGEDYNQVGFDGATIILDPETYWHINEIIFNHDFAKALWGEEQEYGIRTNYKDVFETGALKPGWKFHLQQMVIAEDPIKYLGENI